jgi:hypothetical protein
MDTGAFGRHSLMTEALALKLVSRGSDIVIQPEVAYRPALGGQPLVSKGYVEITIVVAFDTELNDFDTLTNLRFDIVDNIIPGVGCLISNDDINTHELLMRIPKQSDESIADMLANAEHERCDAPIENRTYYVAAITRSGRSTNAMHISEIFDWEQDDMGEPEKEDSLDEALQEHPPESKIPTKGPIVEGTPELQEGLRALLLDYTDLLQKEVNKKPAMVPPMKLNVDEKRWTLFRSNTQRHRMQSVVKDN